MNKEEYALLHYLLAKLKYNLMKDIDFIPNKTLINYINEIEKIIIIGEE